MTGPTGKNSKCAYAGRAIADAPTTITCLGFTAGDTFWVNGNEMTVVANSANRYSNNAGDPYGVNSFENFVWGSTVGDQTLVKGGALGDNWPRLPYICTSNVEDMSFAFEGDGTDNLFGQVVGNTNANWTITQWDTQSVQSMTGMFSGAGFFDQPIGAWNTTHVGDLSSPPICTPNPGVVINCDLSAMAGMFRVRSMVC